MVPRVAVVKSKRFARCVPNSDRDHNVVTVRAAFAEN